MSEVVLTTVEDGIGILTVESPPVNALSFKVRQALYEGFHAFAADDRVKAIVLICKGRTFFAGADISEIGQAPREPSVAAMFDVIENGSRPVVAAIHGTALGGGLELALVCSHRIAVPSAKLGLPEVKLGFLPGAGGTQRLPRIVGVEAALDLIVSGNSLNAHQALQLGVIDAIAGEGSLREEAIAFAQKILASGTPLVRVRDRQDKIEDARGALAIFDDFMRKNARAFRGFKAPGHIVKAVQAAVELHFEEGLERERELFAELEQSIESRAQRHAFFSERGSSKIPDVSTDLPTIPIKHVGVIGAGTMGGGITMNFINAGIPVTPVEMDQGALDRGLAVIRRNYEGSARTPGQMLSVTRGLQVATAD